MSEKVLRAALVVAAAALAAVVLFALLKGGGEKAGAEEESAARAFSAREEESPAAQEEESDAQADVSIAPEENIAMQGTESAQADVNIPPQGTDAGTQSADSASGAPFVSPPESGHTQGGGAGEEFPPEMLQRLGASALSPEDITGSQLLIVVSDGSDARLYAYARGADGAWEEALSAAAHVGRNGVSAEKKEGDGKTPAGLFTLGHAFGAEAQPRTALPYRSVTADSYWVDDVNSKYYNQWIEGTADRDWSSAEHLADYPEAYALAVVIEYNAECVPGAGSAIFLHCGSGATSGCVSVQHDDMLALLSWLQPGAAILIQ